MDDRRSGIDRRGDAVGRDWTSLRAWANAIATIGIPGAIAIWLVYMGATEMPKIAKSVELAVTEAQQTRQLLRDQADQMERLIRTMQRTCLNAAKDDNARQRCFD